MGEKEEKEERLRAHRRAVGEQLKKYRESQKISLYKVAKDGNIQRTQAKAVEEGITNYTIDVYYGYLSGCGLCMNFAPKEEMG